MYRYGQVGYSTTIEIAENSTSFPLTIGEFIVRTPLSMGRTLNMSH